MLKKVIAHNPYIHAFDFATRDTHQAQEEERKIKCDEYWKKLAPIHNKLRSIEEVWGPKFCEKLKLFDGAARTKMITQKECERLNRELGMTSERELGVYVFPDPAITGGRHTNALVAIGMPDKKNEYRSVSLQASVSVGKQESVQFYVQYSSPHSMAGHWPVEDGEWLGHTARMVGNTSMFIVYENVLCSNSLWQNLLNELQMKCKQYMEELAKLRMNK